MCCCCSICTFLSTLLSHMFSDSQVNRKIDRVIRNENIEFYCASKTKPSAAYNQQATTNIISIVKEGKLPNSSKCEAFIDGERIPGGDRSKFPELPTDNCGCGGGPCRGVKLSEQTEPKPLFAQYKRWRRSRDGCRAQYQGRGAFFGWQTMKCRHQMECEDDRKVAMHKSQSVL